MGATINPLKLRVGRTQIWPTLFFTHTEKSYPAIVHPFINFQQALLEILRGITIYKHSSYHTNKRQVLFLFNDAKFLNTGNSLFIFVYLTSDLLLYKSRWFKKFLRIRRVPWYPKYAGLKKRVTPYHLLGRRLQARRRRQKTKKKNTLRKHYFRWFTRKRRRFKFGIRKWWRLQQLRPLFKSARLQSKVYVARAPKIPLELEKEEKVELLDFTEDDNHDFKVDLARLNYQKILKKSLFFKNKKFMTKYRVFYLIFYFYPLLAKLKTLINQWALQTFKQFASSEVFFLRSNVFRVNAYSIVKYAHMLFTEILLDKTAKKKLNTKRFFFAH